MDDLDHIKEDPVDQDIEYVRIRRKQIIDKLTEKGVPDDESAVALLLGALTDMDRTSLSRKKIKVESDAVANNKQAADLIASIFNQPNSKQLGMSANNGVAGVIPSVEGRLPHVEMLPGEMDVNPMQLDYDAFMSKFDK